ncbi:UMP kinase [Candidatus Micrarchaeota archaeon]|nr:UMP kinase [Candidatus Micrarchaeota archaeon]MBU1165975.1 UMP kinase [Candidatus Micrarchaeota archaeon]MBU1886944.1 UMP kinase [Candidatus Micrarchaeota archaeon]
MHIILSVGGSAINPNGEPDLNFLKTMAQIIKKSKNSFGILTGGGSLARVHANTVRKLGGSEYEADQIAIASTRQNAQLMIAALKGAGVKTCGNVLTSFDNAAEHATENKVVVMGGTIPGITTDADAVLLAEAIGAKKLVNISNVDAIYDSDPRKNPKAKKYTIMDYDQLNKLAAESDTRKAGMHFVFDMLACKLIARSGIETHFVSGNKMNDVTNAIEGKKHSGTIVK